MNRALLEKELIRDEGKHLEAYQDSLGYWTIGIGHLLGRERRMTTITERECSALFSSDLLIAEMDAIRIVPGFSLLNEVRQRALVNMAFNLGGSRLHEFRHFLAAMADQSWVKAGAEMMDSRWATQVGNRAKRLEHMVRTGEVLA